MRSIYTLALAAIALVLAGCAELRPYRTEWPTAAYDPAKPSCEPTAENPDDERAGGRVDPACRHRIREDASKYRLYFAEFDDQGWSYPDGSSYGDASRQLGLLSDDLKSLITGGRESISVVVFVHGWKHTAESDDANVKRFRLLLESLDLVEQATGCKRHVIGIYVGWRGAATVLGDPFENLTFFNRKDAAERVALGDVRVLFSQLRADQDLANRAWNERVNAALPKAPATAREAAAPARDAPPALAASHSQCEKRMRLSIAGHSFGGLIVYTSLAQALIRDVVDLDQAEVQAKDHGLARPTMSREGDLVVIVNPAIEASRFEPLLKAVKLGSLPHYHAPLFVAITSSDDAATRVAFPLGRAISTTWEKYPETRDGREKRANQTTLGQDDDFMSHALTAADASVPPAPGEALVTPICAGWNDNLKDFPKRLDIEASESATFLKNLERDGYDAKNLFPRRFCSTEILTLKADSSFGAGAVNSPVWNIRTGKPIVNDHNDFSNPHLIAFFRQLYREAEFKDQEVEQRAKPEGQTR